MGDRSVFVVINPAAGRGRGARRVGRFLSLLREELPAFDHAETSGPGDETRLADEALRAGYHTIVAIGGDGTWSAVADRVIRSGRSDVRLALLPGGTGNDFGKTFGITFDRSREVVRAIREGRTRRVDVGRVLGRTFLNVVGMGFDIAVIRDAERFPFLKGDALYKFCAIRQLFRFPGIPLTIESNGSGAPLVGDFLMVVVANGRYFGGSFLIAPDGDPADGCVDVVAIRDAGPTRRAQLFGLVAKGRHGAEREVVIHRRTQVTITFPRPIAYEVDGEVLEASGPLTIESVPGALELVVPAA